MISVLLIILKTIGIVLLSLIGIVIVLLLLALFVPVRYRFKGDYKDKFICYGKVTWLLHLLSFSINYNDELVTSVKIFGIPLLFSKKNDNDIDFEMSSGSAPDKKNTNISDTALKKPIEHQDIKPSENKKTDIPVFENNSLNNDNIKQTIGSDTVSKRTFFEKVISLFLNIKEKILHFIRKIQDFFKKIRDFWCTIRMKKEMIQHYISILRREEVKQALSLCKKRIYIVLKHILPKKMNIIIDYGFNDPANTGYLLALHGMLPSSLGQKIKLNPDFEKELFVCDFKLKGSVSLWSILYQLICIISDKNCRAFYHIIKKEILNERE